MAMSDVYKFDLIWQIGLGKASSAWYYKQNEADASGPNAIAQALATELELILWSECYELITSDELVLIGSRCQLFAPLKGQPNVNVIVPSFGDIIGNRLANANAVIVSKYPSTWSRSFINRNFMPGFPESHFTGDRYKSAEHATAQALILLKELETADISSPEALTFEQVGFSATIWKNYDPVTQVIEDVYSVLDAIVVQPVLGTQRARIPDRGAGVAV